MSKFIEVETTTGNKVIVNVDYISRISIETDSMQNQYTGLYIKGLDSVLPVINSYKDLKFVLGVK